MSQINLDFEKLAVVDIQSVRPNTWNPKDKGTKEYQEILESIRINGLKGFITVRENPSKDNQLSLYEIIDGEQRWTACVELGFEKIVIYNEGVVDDKKAMELTLWWQTQAPFNELSLAQMITDMSNRFGDIVTPYSEERIEELKQLVAFDWDKFGKNETPPPPQMAELLKTFSIQVTETQYDIIFQAIDKMRGNTNVDITDGKAIEFICAEYLAGE